MAQNEARSSFGDESVFIEKYVDSPKHIEFQVLVDEHGNAVHLGERECSMQRRHQKIIEETPCSIMDDDLRFRMGECAKKIVLAAGYTNAGTVEFMLDKNKNFYFLEVNTRLQVEHPITEMRTGLDLVEQQLRIASGEKLSFTQYDVKFRGAAIECRICAEDPDNNFMPSIGKLKYISRNLGNGMREDTGIEQGNEISIYYDSMISKLISYGPDRKSAIDKMERALRNYTVIGVKTNISFLLNLLKCPEYFDGNYNTQFVEKTFLPRLAETKDVMSIGLEKALAIASMLYKEKGEHNVKVKTGKNGSAKNSWLRRKELY
jgi:acetyl/propionyl-CoA carboxylase alpha subunit